MIAPEPSTSLSPGDQVVESAFKRAEAEWAEMLEWLKDK